MALTILPERFPIGLRVLALDVDTTHHPILHAMGNRFQYQVTTCCMPSFAFNLLSQTKCSFDLIIVDTDMQELRTVYHFLEHVLLFHQIPVIFMSSHYSTNSVMEAITKGASDYWIKPLEERHFQTMWKHVVKDIFHMNKKRGREQVDVPKQTIDENHNHNDDYPSPPTKKFRWSWTQQLHNQFVTVVNELGIENAKPKKILKIMDVPGLTREHVASHLQKLKYKLENGMKKRGRKQKSNSSVLSSSIETHSILEPIHTLHEHERLESDQISGGQQRSEEFCDDPYDIFYDLPDDLSTSFFGAGGQQPLKEFCDDPYDTFYDLPEDLSTLFFGACPPTEVDILSL